MKKFFSLGAVFLCLSTYAYIPVQVLAEDNSDQETSIQETPATYDSTNSTEIESSTTPSSSEEPNEVSNSGTEETSALIDENLDYYEPSPLDRSNLALSGRSSRSTREAIDRVNAGESNRPRVSFVDVSSHNGTITVAQYQMMKIYGVKGVVVKLTEGMTYLNPYADSQIKNAKSAGLKVSVYHYSHYTSDSGAQAEAAYFAKNAIALGLSKETVMVSDIEEPAMRIASLNTNTLAFKNKLNSDGFGKVGYYLSRSWLNVAGGIFDTGLFGKSNIWVAQYPYSPTASQNWNNDFSSWQWSSNFYFPGIAHPFDINTDYTGLFTEELEWDESIPVTGTTTIIDKVGSETFYSATANLETSGRIPTSVYFLTWSEKNGQDDLHWYLGQRHSDGTYSATIDIKNHKDAGDYNVHTYIQLPNGTLKFITSNKFTVSKPTLSAEVGNYNADKGTFDVKVTGVSPSGISRVSVPVWSKDNQSDLKWYDAVKQSDGTYKTTVDIKNHNYNVGTYKVHAYMYSNNGLTDSVAASSINVTLPKVSGVAEVKDTNGKETLYAVTADISLGVYESTTPVYFLTWSEKNGQDDLQWYLGQRHSDGTYSATIDIKNHKDAGNYNIHTYIKLPDGTMKYVTKNNFTVSKPTLSAEVGNYNADKGTFDVKVTGVSPSGISRVSVPVWSKDNQSDLKWYDAVKQSDGTYKTTVDIKNHNYNVGTYKVHAYMYSNNGLTDSIAASSINVTLPKVSGVADVKDTNGKETLYAITADISLGVYGSTTPVYFLTWSEKNGQDDLQWYLGQRHSDGTYSATIDIKNHKDAGNYNIHTYIKLPDGTMKYVTKNNFTVSKPTLSAEVGNYNADKGTFDVKVTGVSPSGISRVSVPVWSKDNQSDLKWYDAVKQSDGTYKTTVDIKNHNYNVGTYKVHAYMYSNNGLTDSIAATSIII
ncbi:GBS Bsp-like repeat-containing protein [Enterococcus caccae]